MGSRRDVVVSDQCDPSTAIAPCATDPTFASTPEPAPVDPTTIVSSSSWRLGAVNGTPVVLQHGFLSSAATWKRMDYWLSRDLPEVSV
jgi:hypothetical protein